MFNWPAKTKVLKSKPALDHSIEKPILLNFIILSKIVACFGNTNFDAKTIEIGKNIRDHTLVQKLILIQKWQKLKIGHLTRYIK